MTINPVPHTPEQALAILRSPKVMPLTCVVCISVLAYTNPTFELVNDRVLVVRDAEFAAIEGPQPGRLQNGIALIDDQMAWGELLVWELAPGVHTITAFSIPRPEQNIPRGRFDWTVTVEAPQPLTRLQQIRLAVLDWFSALQRLDELQATRQEIFESMLAPLPTPAPEQE